MAYFAQIDSDNIVTRVVPLSDDLDEIERNLSLLGGRWVQTSYNTSMGLHRLGGTPVRKNYAGVGYTYDHDRDAFIPPKMFASWVLNEDSCTWNPPHPSPDDGNVYVWSEDNYVATGNGWIVP